MVRATRDLLVRAARRTGYPVKTAWSGHDKGDMGTLLGVVEHHTGTSVNYQRLDDYPTLRVVRDGRPGLENSLSAYGLGRSGTIYCISEKLSWHAGNARWDGTADVNGHYLGIEAESDGTYWSDAQEDCYPRLVAAILLEIGRGSGSHPRHKEVALPRGRKSDWAGLDDAAFDRAVAGYLARPETINRNYGGTAADQGVSTMAKLDDEDRKWLKDTILRAVAVGVTGEPNRSYTAAEVGDLRKAVLDARPVITNTKVEAINVKVDALARQVESALRQLPTKGV